LTLAAGAESSKVDYKPLHHVGNSNEYHANTDQYVCNFVCLYFPLSVLGAPGPVLQPDIRPTKRLFDLMKRHSVSEGGHGDRANNTRCKSTVPGLPVPGLPVLRAVPQGEHGGGAKPATTRLRKVASADQWPREHPTLSAAPLASPPADSSP
jgi:hypothetical protein